MKLIVIEGLDGSGKSSVVDRLSKIDRSLVTIHNPPDDLRKEKDRVDAHGTPSERLSFYLGCSKLIGQHYKETDTTVIVDRYFYTTLVYESLRTGVSLAALEACCALDLSEMLVPDKVIFLDVSREEAMRRLSGRTSKGFSDRFIAHPASYDFLRECYGYFIGRDSWDMIDTTLLNLEEVVSAVRRRIYA